MAAIPRLFLRGLAVLTAGAAAAMAGTLWWNHRDTTIYAGGFSEEAFAQLRTGMGLGELQSLLGEPLASRPENSPASWCYGKEAVVRSGRTVVIEDILRAPRCVFFDSAKLVLRTSGEGMSAIQPGMTAAQVVTLLGEPSRRASPAFTTLHYTEPGGEGLFRARIVALDVDGRISDVISYEFHD